MVGQLFDEHAQALRLFLRGWSFPQEQIDDLVQELFTRLMVMDRLEEKMSDSTGSSRSYLLTMLNNMVVDGKRKLRVRYASAPGQRLVEAGWVAEFDVSADELTAFRPESMDRYQGWRSGMLSFYREPLYQVVQELNRYSHRSILIEDASVMELNVYTAVSIHEIDAALDGLARVLPIEVTRYYDRIVISASAQN